MRGWKIAAAVVGLIVAWFVVNAIVGMVIGFLIEAAIAAAVVGGIYLVIKTKMRSNRQVRGKREESQIRDSYSGSSRLPQVDLEQYSVPRPAPARPQAARPQAARPQAADVEDELARLKREMGA